MRVFILVITVLFGACQQSSTEHDLASKDTVQQVINQDSFQIGSILNNAENLGTVLYVWHIDFENKTKQRNPQFKYEYLHADTLIKGLNELYPDIKLEKVMLRRDTLFVKILNSEYLGERMGSSGAALFIADVIINLTSVDKIRFVKIDFDMGSHASPGVWSANDFSDYKEIQ